MYAAVSRGRKQLAVEESPSPGHLHAPGNEIESPMAEVIGGLLTSTFLNLVVVPVLYLRPADRGVAVRSSPPDMALWRKKAERPPTRAAHRR